MSGGGTAGHVYPAIAVANRFAEAHDDVLFVGTPSGLESRVVPAAGIAFRGMAAEGFDRSRPTTLLTSSAIIAASATRAGALLASYRPDVVLGFGGYVSIPVGAAAALRGVPLVLHEQNSVPGLANKVLSRWARSVGITYEESARFLARPERVTLTGNPVRDEVCEASRSDGRALFGVPDDAIVLLAFGGSRGARHLNESLVSVSDRILADDSTVVVHVAGPLEASAVRESLRGAVKDAPRRWQVHEYIEDMGSALAAADLVVARAGATSIAEITALGRPAVLVPYPYATDDHQTLNAQALVEHDAAVMVPDAEIDDSRFGDVIVELLVDGERRASMAAASKALGRPGAAADVAELARSAAQCAGMIREEGD
jgi:UDP-N-acetylglucosamine--N-acetylmuramyl-(pentapeptide) pyrophosphoryl-undecaprenol N-acetylglucosamine transferase